MPLALADPTTGPADEELVARYRDGDTGALDLLLRRYRRVAQAKARGYFVVGADADDVEQEGMIGLYQAIHNYCPDQEARFGTFAEMCVTRQVLTAVRAANRAKHRPMQGYVSLSGWAEAEAKPESGYEELLQDQGVDPADEVCERDGAAGTAAMVRSLLSRREANVLGHYVDGRSYQEIGDILGCHPKSIDNAVQRIRRKVGALVGQPVAR